MSKPESDTIEFYFRPKENSSTRRGKKEDKIIELTDLAKSLKKTLDSTGLVKWEITLEGYLEASSGFLPGGKAGFKASLKIAQ